MADDAPADDTTPPSLKAFRDQLAKLREQDPQVEYCEDQRTEPRWAVLLKMPPEPTVRQYEHMIHDPAQRADAQRTIFPKMFVAGWTIWDGACDMTRLMKRFPLVHNGAAPTISDMLGLDAKPRGKG
jgi:hypothetical protein